MDSGGQMGVAVKRVDWCGYCIFFPYTQGGFPPRERLLFLGRLPALLDWGMKNDY
jgi:hypothetical protein